MTTARYVSVGALAITGALAFAPSAHATVVATISGCYDCGVYDTPSLVFHNTSGGTLTGASIFLQAYNGNNNGDTLAVSLGTLGAGDTQFFWGSLPGVSGSEVPHNLAAYDYDDEYGGTSLAGPSFCGGIVPINANLCSFVGNFSVVFNAKVKGGTFNGEAVTSVFSPDSNFTGGFVGWEGLNPLGQSEDPLYDVHSGSISGTLAEISLGHTATPEASTWVMLLLGFGGLGLAGYRVKARSVVAS